MSRRLAKRARGVSEKSAKAPRSRHDRAAGAGLLLARTASPHLPALGFSAGACDRGLKTDQLLGVEQLRS